MLATRGGTGDPNAADSIDRESSVMQAVVIFFPVTDLLNLGPSTENPGDGGPPIRFVHAFGPDAKNMTLWKAIGHDSSPIYEMEFQFCGLLLSGVAIRMLYAVVRAAWLRCFSCRSDYVY